MQAEPDSRSVSSSRITLITSIMAGFLTIFAIISIIGFVMERGTKSDLLAEMESLQKTNDAKAITLNALISSNEAMRQQVISLENEVRVFERENTRLNFDVTQLYWQADALESSLDRQSLYRLFYIIGGSLSLIANGLETYSAISTFSSQSSLNTQLTTVKNNNTQLQTSYSNKQTTLLYSKYMCTSMLVDMEIFGILGVSVSLSTVYSTYSFYQGWNRDAMIQYVKERANNYPTIGIAYDGTVMIGVALKAKMSTDAGDHADASALSYTTSNLLDYATITTAGAAKAYNFDASTMINFGNGEIVVYANRTVATKPGASFNIPKTKTTYYHDPATFKATKFELISVEIKKT